MVRAAPTPNPVARRFDAGRRLVDGAPVSLETAAEAAISPLAVALFQLAPVTQVLVGGEFVTVSLVDAAAWAQWTEAIEGCVDEHLRRGHVFLPGWVADAIPTGSGPPTLADKIESILDWDVRPAIAGHGGDIRLVGVEDGVVRLSLRGACSACPSSSATLDEWITTRLMRSLPEIRRVEQADA